MGVVISSLRVGDTHTHTNFLDKSTFKKPDEWWLVASAYLVKLHSCTPYAKKLPEIQPVRRLAMYMLISVLMC